jgi:hypothetical protein
LSPPSNASDFLSAPNVDATNPAPEAPEPMSGPTVVPQSRSWFASLSRRGSSNVSLNQLAQKAPAPPPSEQPGDVQPDHSTAAATVSTTLPPDEPSDNIAPDIPFVSEPQALAANTGQRESEAKLVPRKRAWFAPSPSSSSLPSKRVNKQRPANEPSPPMDSARRDLPTPETTQPPVMNVIPPTPPKFEPAKVEAVEGGPSSETVSVSIPTTRKWFSSASSPQARSPEMEGAVSPSTSSSSQTGANPSSPDHQAPNLASASAGPSSESVSPPVMLSAESSLNLSPLSTSASRFSLTIPFLGRSKVPLERATPSAPHANDVRSEPDTSSLPTVEKAEGTTEGTGEFSQNDG